MTAELSILLLNTSIIVLAYAVVYPKVAGLYLHRVALLDGIATSVAFIIVASKYWGSGLVFSFITVEVSWFWFTLLSYCVIEIPIALWYFRALLKS